MISIIVFFFGMLIGSFLNVCIYRIPEGKSIAFPPSSCGSCNHKLSPLDLVPVLSYAFLRGRCRYCKAHISIQYPLVEVATGCVFLLTFDIFGITAMMFLLFIMFGCMIVIFVIDLRHMIISDGLVLIASVAAVIPLFMYPGSYGLKDSVLGVLAGSGSLFLLYVVGILVWNKAVIGGGDVKLFIPIGILLGWKATLLCLYLAILSGGIVCMILLLMKKRGKGSMVPFGPFIVMAFVVSVLYGNDIINWYLIYMLGF